MAKIFEAITRTFRRSSSNLNNNANHPLPRNSKKTATTSSTDSNAKLIPNGNATETETEGNNCNRIGDGPDEDGSRGGNENSKDGPSPGQPPDWKSDGVFDSIRHKYDPRRPREIRNRHDSSDTDGEGSDSSSSMERMEAPDGGWGWVVVFAAFLINMVSDGVTFSFGIFYVEFYKYFQKDFQSKSPTAWIGSLLAAMPLLSGPIASALTDRYGCRCVTICGSLMAALGFILASFADSLPLIYLTFGVLTGFGLSLCYVAAVVIVAYYFERRRSLATGLSVCGGGIGTFLFAPFTQYLIDQYDNWWQPTRVLAGAFLALSICGLLMKDLEWTKKQRNKSIIPCTESESDEVSNGFKSERLFSSALCIPTFVHEQSNESSPVSRSCTNDLKLQTPKSNNGSQPSDSLIDSNDENESKTASFLTSSEAKRKQSLQEKYVVGNGYEFSFADSKDGEDAKKATKLKSESFRSNKSCGRDFKTGGSSKIALHRHSLTYRGAVISLKRYRLRPASSCPDIISEAATEDKSTTHECKELVARSIKWIKGVYDWQNLSNTRFLLFLFSNFLLYMWYDCPYVYLKEAADQNGHSESSSSKLISIVGLFNMLGNIFLGYIGDKKWTDSTLVYGICMVTCGVTIICLPFIMAWNYVSLAAGCAIFGLTIAANYSLTSVILVKVVSLDGFANAYGLLLLVQGVGNLLGPPLAGVIYDLSGDILWAFVAAGSGILLSSVFILAPKLACRSKPTRENSEVSEDELETGKHAEFA